MRDIVAPQDLATSGGRQNGPVTDHPEAAAERIAARYPKSRGGWVVAGLGLAVAAAGLAWLLWAAVFHANPAVSGQVQSFRVQSDTDVTVVLRVDRPDPSVPGRCTVLAQSEDHRRVGELVVDVPPGTDRIVDLTLTIRTLGRATSASLDGCAEAT